MNLRDEYVATLEAENMELREKVRALEGVLGVRIDVPLVLRLSNQEARLFGILLKREMVTKEQVMDVLYGDRPETDEAEIGIVDVYVCKLRKKLKPFDMEVKTVWGQGYRMPAQSKVTAAALLEQTRAA